MSKIDKLLARLAEKPKDFTWQEAIKILNYYGFEEIKKGKTGGSRRKFANKQKDVISIHEPHPGNILKNYQINLIIQKINQDYEKLF